MLVEAKCDRRGQYLLPCDETEKDRLDFMHHIFLIARDQKLLNVPDFRERPTGSITDPRTRVLDLGCGTGIWLLDMAQRYKNTEFVGVDLAAMGPASLLQNVELRWPCDYECPWLFGEYQWDLIHLQMGFGSVANWPNLYQKVIRHLRPGVGWFEQVEIDLEPRCDDGTLDPHGPLPAWYNYLRDAMTAGGRSIQYNLQTKQMLKAAGLTDISETEIKLPLNSWHREETLRSVGLWYNIALSQGHQKNGGYGLEAMSLAPFTRINKWPLEHARRLCRDALIQLSDSTVHAYNRLHIWTARSPFPNEPR